VELPGGDDTAARLRKLQALFEQGLITESEYAARKAAILEDI
jgi:hypothetical protein